MLRRGVGLGLLLWAVIVVPGVHAQGTDVEGEVRATLRAWADGEYETFVGFYHPDARGFFLDGGPLMQGFSVQALQAVADAGFRAQVAIDDLDVKRVGETAVSVAYLVGKLTLPGGLVIDGSWRYSETRVRTDAGWRVIQFHVSRLEG